jgi:hypothetical protein
MIQRPYSRMRPSSTFQVTAHHEDLLTQASNANALSGTLSSVRSGLDDLDASVEKYVLRALVLLHHSSLLEF